MAGNMHVGLIIIKAGESIKELTGEQLDGGWKEWCSGNETALSTVISRAENSAVYLLGYKQIEVRHIAVKDAEHQLNLEISENEARKDFSKTERIDYARRLERIESLKAEKRMKIGKADPMETFPQGTTRDIVASKLGIGLGKQYEKEKYIADNRDSLAPEDFVDWDESKLSTNRVYKITCKH